MPKAQDTRSLLAGALLGEDGASESDLDAALRLYAERREHYFNAIGRQMEKAMSGPRTFGNPRN
jgi:hypothetical protein